MAFPWIRPSILTSDLPRTLKTATSGEMRLRVSYLIRKSTGLVYVEEEMLRPGNEIRLCVRHYSPEQPPEDGIKLLLHPPGKGKVEVERWVRIYDERHLFLREHWRALIVSQPAKLLKLIKKYGADASQWSEIQKCLHLAAIKIIIDADDELTFGPFKHFPSFDLNIEVDRRNQITNAAFDG